jgi:dTDP-4-dehydrorhamnose 3,5-epimerase
MKFIETKLKGCFILEPTVFNDDRGLFYESYKKKAIEDGLGKSIDFVQDNVSISKKGVLRGLHFQQGIHAQAKLVKVVKGEALDVVVDLRKDSATFGQHFKTRLSEHNCHLLYIPKGMAHGFFTLEDNTVFVYKCDNYYNHMAEGGIVYNDVDLNIDWEIPETEVILSNKDIALPTFRDLKL